MEHVVLHFSMFLEWNKIFLEWNKIFRVWVLLWVYWWKLLVNLVQTMVNFSTYDSKLSCLYSNHVWATINDNLSPPLLPIDTSSDTQIYGPINKWGVLCQKQVARAGTSNHIPHILWDVITCPCPWYLSNLLLAQWRNDLSLSIFKSSGNMTMSKPPHPHSHFVMTQFFTIMLLKIQHAILL